VPAITSTDICNRALQKLGAKRIATLSESSVSARAVNLAYDIVRKSELRKRVWNFSIERDSLAADSPVPTWGRQNSFTLPSDFIRLAESYPEDLTSDSNAIGVSVAFTATFTGQKDWVIEQAKILTNDTAPLQIRYVMDVTDTTLFDPIFSEALSTAIAFEICEELTQSNTKKAALGQAYLALIEEAKLANSIEVAPADPPPDTWLAARN
jgi:hypothetical protein